MAASSATPPVGVVPVIVQLMPLVWALQVTRRALVLLVMLMVTLVPLVLGLLAPLVMPMVRALLVMDCWVVPLVMLRR